MLGEQERLAVVGGPPGYPFDVLNRVLDIPAETVALSWSEPLSMHLNRLFVATVMRMAHLADGDLDSVRCVHWFDQ